MASPLLIALPHGLNVSGVTVWAVRLAKAWAGRGGAAALLVHGEPPGHRRLRLAVGPGVQRIDLSDLPLLETGDLKAYLGRYRDAVRRLVDRHGAPVVLSPNLLGNCYGIAAALCQIDPEAVRVVGWHHSDIEYNDRVLAHYEPVLARLVGVSDRIDASLRRLLPQRRKEIVNIPYGVPVARSLPDRGPVAGRPVRLIYTGRVDHEQKRIMALAHLAPELERRAIAHELVVIGDGPATPAFDAAVADAPTVRRLPAVAPHEIERRLDHSDALLLASRYEGLSVSMIEAMARGCVPVVTRVESGVGQAIEAGVSGELADVPPEATEGDVAVALADAIERFLAGDTRAMSEAAWRTARQRFSIECHVDRVEAMVCEVVGEAPRRWPTERPCAFPSVPSDGAERLASTLQRLSGRRIIVHGTGQHTRQLSHVLERCPAEIVAFSNDDRQQHGQTLWRRPIIPPQEAAATGATDVVISSWINERAIWRRCKVYEDQGLSVHRLYEEENQIAEASSDERSRIRAVSSPEAHGTS